MVLALAGNLPSPSTSLLEVIVKNRLQVICQVNVLPIEKVKCRRRLFIQRISVPLFSCLISSLAVAPAWAGDETIDKDEGVIGSIVSLFDPDEKTKSGKVLPKAYLKSAREVVKTLRSSLTEKPKDITDFRRNADAAKESIREFINGWKGQTTVVNEESYAMIEKAIRSLATFYSKAGPSATLPDEIKIEILGDLDTAEQFL